MSKHRISIVFSVFNELGQNLLKDSLDNLSVLSGIEVIIVDGGSTDGTIDLVKKYPVKLIQTEKSSRAERLNVGIDKAENDLILLHHPRSIIEPSGLEYLQRNYKSIKWGGFSHRFIEDLPLLKFTSWYSNEVRGKIRSIIYLDHCIFFKKSLLSGCPVVPELFIFEDTALSEKLNKLCPAQIIPFVSRTSAIRFNKNGFFRQSLLNLVMKVCFLLNVSDEFMNKVYEKGLGLNTRY